MIIRHLFGRTRLLASVCGVVAVFVAVNASAQTSTGQTATSCSQSGSEVTCTTVTKFTIPSGVNLQAGNVATGNFVLTGTTAGGPNCSSVSASPATVSANVATSISLQANGCAAGTTFTWQSPASGGANPTSTTLTLASGSQTYSVSACLSGNCQTYTSNAVTVSTPVTAPSGCSMNAAITTGTAPGVISLSASCTSGGAATNYVWSRNGSPISGGSTSTPSFTDTGLAAGNYSYSVVASNSGGSAPAANAPSTLTITAGSSGSACTGGLQVARTLNIGGPSSSPSIQWFSTDDRAHPDTTPYIVQLNVASGVAAGLIGTLTVSEFTPPFDRQIVVSQTCGDSTTNLLTAVGQGAYVNFAFDAATFNGLQPTGGAFSRTLLTPGTWYVHFRSLPLSCPTSWRSNGCSMNMQWQGLRPQ
jgi:hypothetical protein